MRTPAPLSTSSDTPVIGEDPRAPVQVDAMLMCESCLAIVDHVMTSLKKKARRALPQTLPSSHALLRAACCVHVRAPHTPRLPARMSTARTVATCCQLSMPYNPAGHSEEHGDCGLRPARRRLRVRLPFSVCVCAGACARCQHCATTPMVRSQDNMKRFKFIPPKMVKGCQVSRRGGGGGCLLCCLPAPPGTHAHVAARSHLPVSSLPLAPYALPDSSASVT
jgi:hypothetical protein